jgi:multicomponent Na+:H+ antiporter subunit G
MSEIIAYIFIGIGVTFNFFGCLGLLRFPDIYNRLQAGTKCVTFGTIFILLGTLIAVGINATGIKAIICMLIILITSPTAAHAISKGAYKSGVKLWDKSITDEYKKDNPDKKKD